MHMYFVYNICMTIQHRDFEWDDAKARSSAMKKQENIRKRADQLRPSSKRELRRLAQQSDRSINYDDIPPINMAAFEAAVEIANSKKEAISLRVDEPVLNWFRRQGPGYQARMRQVLREHMIKKSLMAEKS